jgi:hypothetical protein
MSLSIFETAQLPFTHQFGTSPQPKSGRQTVKEATAQGVQSFIGLTKREWVH